ncbi:MAG: transposase family protein [Rhodobacteraceae bacterium]|nr:transposase family protein [Paracoccaceae bacterium]
MAVEVLIDLRRRLDQLPARSGERRDIMRQAAALYGLSESTLYRLLEKLYRPKALRRADQGVPRTLPQADMVRYCEVIAALKIRTMNKKGRHISTVRAIEVLEEMGIDTPDGLVKPEQGRLHKATVNRYLKQWGFDHWTLTYQVPAVRFQARHSNECWQFDLSPSDLKHVKEPLWHDPAKGRPILMLYSLVDDRSGVCYQEYRNVYGEDVEAALRFLFNAMSAKADTEFPFRGIPAMLYMDNGPIAKSRVFQRVMASLGIQIQRHMPDSKDKRRHTARAKGKVERAFRTVKEAHEVLYHLREPKDEAQANERLLAYLKNYNDHPHRSEPHSRLEDWQENLPAAGIREMCSWERFCTFAREPENRKVGIDARISVDGVVYEVHADLAGDSVILWWGLFDNELYVEHEEQRYGPYTPINGPIPLHRYRKFKKTKTEKRLEKLEALAKSLVLGETEGGKHKELPFLNETEISLPSQPFQDPDPFHDICFANGIKARRAIADYLGKPLALLTQAQKDWIDVLLEETLDKQRVMQSVREYFRTHQGGSHVT